MHERISATLARHALDMLNTDELRALLELDDGLTDDEIWVAASESVDAISPPGPTDHRLNVDDREAIVAGLRGEAVESVNRARVGGIRDGWQQIGLPCFSDRRALWVRMTPGIIELCAGREGDDAYVVVDSTNDCYLMLREVLRYASLAAGGRA